MHRTVWLLLAGLVLVISIPLLLGGGELWRQLADFPPLLLALMIAMIFACWYLNAAKLKVLLAGRSGHLTHRQAMGVVMATEFAICATPGGAGGPLTLIALMKQRGMRPAQTTAVYAVDQMIDLLFFFTSMAALLIYIAIRAIDVRLGWMLGMPMILMATGLALILLIGRYHARAIRAIAGLLLRLRIRHDRRARLMRRLLVFRNALAETLKMPRHLLLAAFFFGVLHWIVRYSVLYFALYGLGRHLDWGWTFLVQMLSMAAGQLTLLPGGAGGAELSSLAMLTPIVGQHAAAAAILIWRAVTYYFYLIAGAPVFLYLAGRPLMRKIFKIGKQQLED
ncbi:lysylphosphatidylglycerol synthase transmembrane domain-containing protein [Halotalea alkalilenta]|uniref:lysylphosphatidylglycerol synthase transmembrane domain-containing protein n=1 Tax=Halotalea alkalilenta TaxID=376489 RepID=UPI00047F96C8|nr:lysylphosphatidylglycerol synthase transmembrane domain-containing protein [Halotalea alkalilenta]